MKKLMLSLMVVLFMTSVQAANIIWRTGTLYAPVSGALTSNANSGTELANGAAYSATIYFFTSEANALSYLVDSESVTPLYVDTGSGYKNSIPLSQHWINNQTAGDVFSNSVSEENLKYYWAYVVITSPATTNLGEDGYWELTSSVVSFKMGGSGNETINIRNLDGFNSQSWQWVGEPIPEPATMALVGIGVAVLGLRRRRK